MLLFIPAPRWSVFLENFFGHGNGGHGAGPAGVKRQVGDRFDQLILCHAVFQRQGELRALRDSPGRAHTSPNSTLSVSSANLGEMSPNILWAGVACTLALTSFFTISLLCWPS